MQFDRAQISQLLLGAVVLSSLTLLAFGLQASASFFVFLHYPTVIAQVLFIVAVFMRSECRVVLTSLKPPQRYCLFALLIYVPLTSYLSPIPAALYLSQFWLVHILFFVALVGFFRAQTTPPGDAIWLVLGLAALFHVIAFLIAWAIWPDQVRIEVLPVFENIRFLGYFLAPASSVMAVCFITRHHGWALPLVGYVAATFYIIYTGSRGGAISIFVGLVIAGIYLALHRQKVLMRRVAILFLATCALVFLSNILPRLPWPPLFDRATAVVDQSGTEALTGRRGLWLDVIGAIQERWVLGYGPAFVNHVSTYALDPAEKLVNTSNMRNTHNIVLQLLMNWGVIGCAVIVGAVLTFAGNLRSALCHRPALALLPLVALVTMLVHSLVSGVFFYPYSTVIGLIAFVSLESIGWRARMASVNVKPAQTETTSWSP